jgi:hypothetical protein
MNIQTFCFGEGQVAGGVGNDTRHDFYLLEFILLAWGSDCPQTGVGGKQAGEAP